MALTLTVTGMSCEHCEQTVREALERVDGVESAAVDRHSEQATVDGDVELADVVAAVEDAGYTAVA